MDRSLVVSHHHDSSVSVAAIDTLSTLRFLKAETIAIAISIGLIFQISELESTSDQQVPYC